MDFKIENTCASKRDFCIGCNSHFTRIRPLIKEVLISKHFYKDLKDENGVNSIVRDVLDCSHMEFNELHKFEEKIDGVFVFRAKRENLHIVYCVDKKMRILFLRAMKNFEEYKKFIEDKKEILSVVEGL
jgi:mRNA-degrading endonuclease RelE of RelBE toxin-antitoxin system